MSRLTLTYCDDLGSPPPNTFWLLRDGFTIRACIKEPETPRRVVEFPVYFLKPRQGAHAIRPADAEASMWFFLEPGLIHPGMLMDLQFADVPAIVASAFREI